MKIKTYWQAVVEDFDDRDHEEPKGESLTVQEGYESLEDMIPRIIRGEIRPRPVLDYEFVGDVSDDVFDRPVFDNLDDLTDIDKAKDIIKSHHQAAVAEGSETAVTGENTSMASVKQNANVVQAGDQVDRASEGNAGASEGSV